MSNIREQFGGRLVVRMNAGVRRQLKRQYAKWRRRQARRQPEDAPTKRAVYSGWYD